MKALVGDIGNSVTKICLIETKNFKIKEIIHFNSKDILSQNKLLKYFKKITRFSYIKKFSLFSCVVPKYHVLLKKFLKKNYEIQLKEIKENNINKIIKINVKNKKQVGSDRIANAVGVFKKYKTNCIVLDFGTATTFDVVTKNGTYNGGIIAPGVNLAISSLVQSADQIPFFSIKKQKKVIGKNTIDALRSGFYWGYSGLINNIISKIEKETKKNIKLFLLVAMLIYLKLQ